MVEDREHLVSAVSGETIKSGGGHRSLCSPLRARFWLALIAGTTLLAMATVLVPLRTTGLSAGSTNPPAVSVGHVRPTTTASTTTASTITASTVVTTTQASAASGASVVPVSTPAPQQSVASMVAQVEAAGIVPPTSWIWTMGDTAVACGVTPSAGGGAGCTSWSSGVEHTVFAGSPTLALVAHEVANAETEQSALPALLSEVSTAAAGTSWSPTDAVSSCLVEHFLGFQDAAAGSWQCPPALASVVAAHIHDTVPTTQTTAVCGTSSGVVSTLTFTANAGTLTVTSPSASQTAGAGVPVTVSGVGTFTAVDQGGAATVAGVCEG